MAYSGTVAQTAFNTRKVVENAVRRCKIPVQQITAETVEVANDQLYLMLSELANSKLPLWCVEKSIYPLYEGTPAIDTHAGTVDLLNANLRSLQPVTGTDTVTTTEQVTEFDSATQVTTVGLKWTGGSVPIEFARSDDNVTWTVIQTEVASAGPLEWAWYDLDVAVASIYFRVRATSGLLDVSQIYLGNTPTEIPMTRMNRDDYTNLPNKTMSNSRPLQYWLDRKAASPVIRMWPVPNLAAETSQIVVWAHRQIMDVGTLTQDLEVPQRWLEAVVAGLAARLASELTEVDPQMVPILEQKAQAALYLAQAEERDNSPMMLAPNISPYTA
jgi:hypothetical protein